MRGAQERGDLVGNAACLVSPDAGAGDNLTSQELAAGSNGVLGVRGSARSYCARFRARGQGGGFEGMEIAIRRKLTESLRKAY